METQAKRAKRGKYKRVPYVKWGGIEVVGLKKRPNGRFYAAANPNKEFGTDPALAVHRYRQWEIENGDGAIEPLDDVTLGDYPNHLYHIRNLILTNPRQAALELDIPELAHFHQLRPPPDPTITLDQLGERYIAGKRNKRGRALSPKHQKNSRVWWNEFVTFVKVRHANHITESHVREYGAEILRRFDDGKSQAYVKHRFGKVKAVLAYGIKAGIDKDELNRVLQDCLKILETPEPPLTDPKPISPEHFDSLFQIANIRQRAILLTALNLCMKSGEVADLDKDDVDWTNGTVVTQRSKTGVTRVGVLWQRTLKAIRLYQKKYPHGGKHIFNSRIGTRLTAKAAARIVIHLRRKAGIPESVNFDTIRDGGYTAAIEHGASEVHAKLLAGHKVSMADQYVRRNPRMVADACEAIEFHYFGKE